LLGFVRPTHLLSPLAIHDDFLRFRGDSSVRRRSPLSPYYEFSRLLRNFALWSGKLLKQGRAGVGASQGRLDHLSDVFPMPIDAIVLKVKLAMAETGRTRRNEGPLDEITH